MRDVRRVEPMQRAPARAGTSPTAAALRRLRAHTYRVRLVAVDAQGGRPLGEYTFAHTPG